MLAHVERNNLEQYYDRTYSGGLLTRMLSLTGVAAVTSLLGVWPPLAAVIWLGCYISGELGLTYYWGRIRGSLKTANLADITVAVGWFFMHKSLPQIADSNKFPNLVALSAQCESLPAFQACKLEG